MQLTDNIAALRNLSALVDFANLINSSLDLSFALNNILFTCFGKFQTTKGIILLINEQNLLEIKAAKGFSQASLSEISPFALSEYETNEVFTNFKKINKLVFCHEIKSSNGLKGYILLGERLSKKDYTDEDAEFLFTIINIGATAIDNSLIVSELKELNRELDAKVNQLSSLFDLSKEFSGILKVEMIGKLLLYSIIGQLMVSKYSVITCKDSGFLILENKYPKEQLEKILNAGDIKDIASVLKKEELVENYKEFTELGVELIVPMQIKGVTKGLIMLGQRIGGQPYSKSDIEFIASVGSLAIISIENALLFSETLEKQKMEKDLETARNIQKNLLPKSMPKMHSFDIAAFNNSARQVGGDYYDLVKLSDEETLFAIGDVSGKGVPAALLMANLQAFLKSICKQGMRLDDASCFINDLVSDNTTNGSFITFFWGILNDKTRSMEYVNAGHNPPLLIRNNEIKKLKTGGMILGVMATVIPYSSEVVQLETGDLLVFFTDGITEAMDPDFREYSDERLEELALKVSGKGAHEILEVIREDVKIYIRGAEQSDDITLIIIKVT